MKLEQKNINSIALWVQTRHELWQKTKKIANKKVRAEMFQWIRERFPIEEQTEGMYWLSEKLDISIQEVSKLLREHKPPKQEPEGLGGIFLILAGVSFIVAVFTVPAALYLIFTYDTRKAYQAKKDYINQKIKSRERHMDRAKKDYELGIYTIEELKKIMQKLRADVPESTPVKPAGWIPWWVWVGGGAALVYYGAPFAKRKYIRTREAWKARRAQKRIRLGEEELARLREAGEEGEGAYEPA